MIKNVYTIALLIFIIIMLIFMITNIFFRDIHYFRTSVMMSSFVLPVIFALGAFYSVTTYSRIQKVISFREAYGRAFIPMFLGGLLSVISIFLYINYVDTPTKDLLNYQYIESYRESLDDEYNKAKAIVRPDSAEMHDLENKYAEGKIRISEKVKRKEDMFTPKYFAYVFAGYSVFFLLLSLFFGSFFRTKTSE